ncbi:hypothetical protein BH09DEP1_BH09DEP1_4280 [soil metagenome]
MINIKKIMLCLVLTTCYVHSMEQDNSILTCVTQAPTVEQACESATELLKKQSTARKITTQRFLLACQQKFHRSMFEVGFSMATSESLEIADELTQDAKKVWATKPENRSFAEYLFDQKNSDSDKIPSLLYYIYAKSDHAQKAQYYTEEAFISGTINRDSRRMALWIDSGILQNKRYLGDLFQGVIQRTSIALLSQLLSTGFDPNVTIKISMNVYPLGQRKKNNTYLPTTVLDYATEYKVAYEQIGAQYGAQYKDTVHSLTQMIRLLIKADAKFAVEL